MVWVVVTYPAHMRPNWVRAAQNMCDASVADTHRNELLRRIGDDVFVKNVLRRKSISTGAHQVTHGAVLPEYDRHLRLLCETPIGGLFKVRETHLKRGEEKDTVVDKKGKETEQIPPNSVQSRLQGAT